MCIGRPTAGAGCRNIVGLRLFPHRIGSSGGAEWLCATRIDSSTASLAFIVVLSTAVIVVCGTANVSTSGMRSSAYTSAALQMGRQSVAALVNTPRFPRQTLRCRSACSHGAQAYRLTDQSHPPDSGVGAPRPQHNHQLAWVNGEGTRIQGQLTRREGLREWRAVVCKQEPGSRPGSCHFKDASPTSRTISVTA